MKTLSPFRWAALAVLCGLLVGLSVLPARATEQRDVVLGVSPSRHVGGGPA